MNSPATCPCCGVVVMTEELSYDFDGETVASLTREVAYLRETVARLRAAPHTPPRPGRARAATPQPAPSQPAPSQLGPSQVGPSQVGPSQPAALQSLPISA